MSGTNATVRSSHVTPQFSGRCNPCNRNGCSLPLRRLSGLFSTSGCCFILLGAQLRWLQCSGLAAEYLVQQSAAISGTTLPCFDTDHHVDHQCLQRHRACAVASHKELPRQIYSQYCTESTREPHHRHCLLAWSLPTCCLLLYVLYRTWHFVAFCLVI